MQVVGPIYSALQRLRVYPSEKDYTVVKVALVALNSVVETLCSAIALSCFNHSVKLDGNCDNLFASSRFLEAQNEWQRIFNESFARDVHPELQEHLSQNLESLSIPERRHWYRQFKKIVRELPSDTRSTFCKKLFLDVSIGPTTIPPYETGSLHGIVHELFDAQLLGNFPHKLTNLPIPGLKTPLTLIRTPSVTQDTVRTITGSTVHAKLTNEFLGFIEGLDATEHHIYVNLMHRTHGNEATRSKVLESYDHSKLTVLTLDRNSDFYKQKKEWSGEVSSQQLRDELLERLYDPRGAFYIPSCIDQTGIEGILDSIPLADNPGREDRIFFLELFYCKLVTHLAIKKKATSLNLSCKHSIDRGASMTASLLAYYQKEEAIQKTLLREPAYFIANRPMQSYYFERANQFKEKV